MVGKVSEGSFGSKKPNLHLIVSTNIPKGGPRTGCHLIANLRYAFLILSSGTSGDSSCRVLDTNQQVSEGLKGKISSTAVEQANAIKSTRCTLIHLKDEAGCTGVRCREIRLCAYGQPLSVVGATTDIASKLWCGC